VSGDAGRRITQQQEEAMPRFAVTVELNASDRDDAWDAISEALALAPVGDDVQVIHRAEEVDEPED
jgi:surface antigen